MKQLRLLMLIVSLLCQRSSYAQDTEPPTDLEFLGFKTSEIKNLEIPVTLGVFRFTNNTEMVMYYSDRYGTPDLMVSTVIDGRPQIVHWNWCGNGSRVAELKPKQTIYFYIDPKYHRTRFGDNLRFCFSTTLAGKTIPTFHWSKWIQTPLVDNPTQVPQSRFFAPEKQQATADPLNQTTK